MFRAGRQTKPSAPPSLLSKGLQTGWGRRFRLPGQFFRLSDAWGYVEIVAARSEESLEIDLRSQLDLSRRAGDAVADPSKDRRSQNRRRVVERNRIRHVGCVGANLQH